MPHTPDTGTLQLAVVTPDGLRKLTSEVHAFRKKEREAKSSEQLRLCRAVHIGLVRVLETSPDGGILHVELQMFIRTAGGGKQPLSREEQTVAMEIITDRVTRLMKAERAARQRLERARRHQLRQVGVRR